MKRRISGIIIIVISLIGALGSPVVGLIGVLIGAYLVWYDSKERKKEAIQEQERKERAAAHAAEIVAEKLKFSSELDAIEHVAVTVEDDAPKLKRPKLSEMPEVSISTVTKRTNIDKIFPLVVIDTETTGIKKQGNDIVELSAIKLIHDFEPVSCFTTLLKPRYPIPADASAVNNITDEMVEDAPELRQVAKAFNEFIHGCNIIGHNVKFDLEFLFVSGIDFPANVKVYDTLALSRSAIKKSDIHDYKLSTLCDYFGIYRSDAHRSLSDCYATAKVFEKLVEIRHDM